MNVPVCCVCFKRLLPGLRVQTYLSKPPIGISNTITLPSAKSTNYGKTGAVRCMSVKVKQRQPRQRLKSKQPTHEDYPFLPQLATQQVYVLDDSLADQIVDAVRKNQTPDVTVLESNPGPGIVTRKLLQAGVKHVVAVESLEGFITYLESLQEEVSPNKLTVFHWQYAGSSLPQWKPDTVHEQSEDRLASRISPRKATDSAPLMVLNVIPHLKEGPFFKCLLSQWANHQGLFTVGQPEWFLVISSQFYKGLLLAAMEEDRPTKQFTNLAVVLLLLFDVHVCAEIPGKMFTPSFPEKRRQTTVRAVLPEVTDGMRYLVRFRSRPDPAITSTEFPAFYNYLKQVLQKRKNRLIPKMELLIPGCGIRLIMLGITMMTKTGDLNLELLVDIFKMMQSWPEYEGSPMKQYLSETLMSPHEDEPHDDS